MKIFGESFMTGDRVYLFVPSVKRGRSRKQASLWRGLYTVIDCASPVSIQLIGTNKISIVHMNRLKICYEEQVQGSTTTVNTIYR